MPSDTTDHRRPTTVKNHHHLHGLPPQEPEHLPCPRCDSTNTKFCYYNNYNFSQPRHFCKACRRYWTQGGTLRDIPVGGGSRKNAKRQRVCHTSTSRDILPTVTTNPVLMSFSGAHTGAPLNGGFTSLLSSNTHSPGFFGAGVCGFDQDVGFGLGRMGWAFSGMGGGVGSGGSAAVSGGDGNTWQFESGDGYVLSDLAISTPGSGMKIE